MTNETKCKQCTADITGINTDEYCSYRCRYIATHAEQIRLEKENKLLKDTLHMWQKAYMVFHAAIQDEYLDMVKNNHPLMKKDNKS